MVKKTLFAAILAFGGWYAYKRMQSGRSEQDLWAEATDSVGPNRDR